MRERTRRRVIWTTVGVLGAIVIAAAAVVAIAGLKALHVRDALTSAVPVAQALPAKVAAGDPAAVQADAESLKRLASEAVEETNDFTWHLVEPLPVIGANFSAVRLAAEGVDEVADFVLRAAPALDVSAFRPVDGAVDITALRGLGDIVSEGSAVFSGIRERLAGVEPGGLLPQVSEAVTTLDETAAGAEDALTTLEPILKVLPAALGEQAPRTYLLMFQGNSELRASGGNPAALALVTAREGRIELTTQATSVQFDNARPASIAPLDAETEHLYSDIIGRWIPNMTATPHFPTTVEIMRAWWADEGLPPFDDVISVDPVALSYMLRATGPIPLQTGETLTSENAVPLLLNEVYFKYGEGSDASAQDAFFAAAAAQIFSTLTSSIEDPVALLNALRRSTEEGRLKIWSSNEDIEGLVADTRLAGTLPATNDSRTVVGAFFNDTTGAKTDYYADASVVATTDQCTATGRPTITQTITFADNITPEQAAALPYFITGPHFAPGTIATDVVVYSPVGGTIESWSIEGAKSHRVMSSGTHLGREVVRLNFVTTPQTKATITVEMKGPEGSGAESGPLEVWTTPMVRATPVTIEAPGCK